MLNITSDAARVCSESVRQLSVLAHTKLPRFTTDGRGVSIVLEAPKSGDEIVYYGGKAVLAVPEDIADDLSDLTLDVSDEGIFVLA
jgi:hypothetical protein